MFTKPAIPSLLSINDNSSPGICMSHWLELALPNPTKTIGVPLNDPRFLYCGELLIDRSNKLTLEPIEKYMLDASCECSKGIWVGRAIVFRAFTPQDIIGPSFGSPGFSGSTLTTLDGSHPSELPPAAVIL